jgi:hypothetical protein
LRARGRASEDKRSSQQCSSPDHGISRRPMLPQARTRK